MKLRRLLVLWLMLLALLPGVAFAYTPTETEAYQWMISLKDEFYEGRPWTNVNYYGWNGGYFSGGYGCAGFAFRLSDEAFGTVRCTVNETFSYEDLKVGDILRVNNNTHSVIIMEIFSNYIIIAEGNYNSSIHWGRTLTKSKVMESDYVMTRYPASMTTPTSGGCGLNALWSYSGGVLTITGTGKLWDFKSIFGTGTMDAPWAPFASSITRVNIPAGITGIGYAAFADCTNLKDVYFDGTKTEWNAVTIASLNTPLTSATLHTSTDDPGNLLTLTLPDSLRVIVAEAFMNATEIQKVVIPAGCERIESKAFANCTALQLVYLSRSTVVASDAFAGCPLVRLVYID